MPATQAILFFVTLFVLIALELIVIYLIWSYYRLLKSYDQIMAKQRQMDQDVASKSRELLTAAEQQAQSVVMAANTKATQIVTQAQGFDAQTQAVIQKALQTFLTEQTQVYRTTFDAVRKDVLAYVEELDSTYRKRAEQEIGEISQKFGREMEATTTTAKTALAAAYQKIDAEVETYRQQRLKNVEEQVAQTVKRVLREVLHQAIEPADQDRLIMEALDAAHQDHIL